MKNLQAIIGSMIFILCSNFVQSSERRIEALKTKNPSRYEELSEIQHHLDKIARNLAVSTQNPNALKVLLDASNVEGSVLSPTAEGIKDERYKVIQISLEKFIEQLSEGSEVGALNVDEYSAQSLSEQVTTYSGLPKIPDVIQLNIATPKTLSSLAVQSTEDISVLVVPQPLLNQPPYAFNQSGKKVAINKNQLKGKELVVAIQMDEKKMLKAFVQNFNEGSFQNDLVTTESLAPQGVTGCAWADSRGAHDYLKKIWFKDAKEDEGFLMVSGNAEIFALVAPVLFTDLFHYRVGSSVYMIDLPEINSSSITYTYPIEGRQPSLANWNCLIETNFGLKERLSMDDLKNIQRHSVYPSGQTLSNVEPTGIIVPVLALIGLATLVKYAYDNWDNMSAYVNKWWYSDSSPIVVTNKKELLRMGAVVQFYEHDWSESEFPLKTINLKRTIENEIQAKEDRVQEWQTVVRKGITDGLGEAMKVIMGNVETAGAELVDEFVFTPLRYDPTCLPTVNGELFGDKYNGHIRIEKNYVKRNLPPCNYENPLFIQSDDVMAMSSPKGFPAHLKGRRGQGFVVKGSGGFDLEKVNAYSLYKAKLEAMGKNSKKFPPECVEKIQGIDKISDFREKSRYIEKLKKTCIASLDEALLRKTGGETHNVFGYSIPEGVTHFRVHFVGQGLNKKSDIPIVLTYKTAGKIQKNTIKPRIHLRDGIAYSIGKLEAGRGKLVYIEIILPTEGFPAAPEVDVVGYN